MKTAIIIIQCLGGGEKSPSILKDIVLTLIGRLLG